MFVTGALAAGALLASCARHHPPDVEGFRRAARTAVHVVRPAAPNQAKLIEQLVALAEVATAAEAAAPWWEGSVGRTEAAWLRVSRAAHDATFAVRTAHAQALGVYTALHPEVRNELVRAQAEISAILRDRHHLGRTCGRTRGRADHGAFRAAAPIR